MELHKSLRELIYKHGLNTVLQALVDVCRDHHHLTEKGVSYWKMASSLLGHSLTRLSDLREIPGITEPLPLEELRN